jgi:hypothetical protein
MVLEEGRGVLEKRSGEWSVAWKNNNRLSVAWEEKFFFKGFVGRFLCYPALPAFSCHMATVL